MFLFFFKKKRSPFNLRNEKKSLLLARYLIEDNQEEFIIYDGRNSIEKEVILSIFNKIIGGSYSIFSRSEEHENKIQLINVKSYFFY